jgi:hypothetical protein
MTTEVNVIEGNKLINIFMHGVLHDGTVQYYEGPDNFQHEGGAFLKYHKDWNWLMPVVEKIEHEITPVEILDFQCRISRTIYNPEQILTTSDESKIAAVYNAVIQFITWYNQNKEK